MQIIELSDKVLTAQVLTFSVQSPMPLVPQEKTLRENQQDVFIH